MNFYFLAGFLAGVALSFMLFSAFLQPISANDLELARKLCESHEGIFSIRPDLASSRLTCKDGALDRLGNR